MSIQSGGVSKMQMGRAITMISKHDHCCFETLDLILSQRLTGSVVSRSKMTHQPIDANVAKSRQRRHKLTQFIKTNSQSSHSRINFHVYISDNSSLGSRAIERFNHVETINDRRKLLLHADLLFNDTETTETK